MIKLKEFIFKGDDLFVNFPNFQVIRPSPHGSQQNIGSGSENTPLLKDEKKTGNDSPDSPA